MRATYCRVPLVTVTWTVPRGTVTLTSKNNRLNTVSTQKPTTAATMAQVGTFCSLCQYSLTCHVEPASGMSPAGVCTTVDVTLRSPIWTITGPGAAGPGGGTGAGGGAVQGSSGREVTPA